MGIGINETGICPHCKIANRFEYVGDDRGTHYTALEVCRGSMDIRTTLEMCKCTNCGEIIILFDKKMVYPLGSTRSSAPKEVPFDIAQDFNEAILVEPLSKKASAALGRRCLQNMLHQQGIVKGNLSEEIDEAMKILPPHLSEAIDAIRNIGNFATHPIKFQSTGTIVDVEDGETEWVLDVLEQLFDFYYVQPEITKAKKEALNEKLKALGKPPAK